VEAVAVEWRSLRGVASGGVRRPESVCACLDGRSGTVCAAVNGVGDGPLDSAREGDGFSCGYAEKDLDETICKPW
jgi:hypothetical protein